MAVSALSIGAAEGWPICNMNFPSLENLIAWRSFAPFPVIQTFPVCSTKILCSVAGQSYPLPGPPHDLIRSPWPSNSSTGGAEVQHMDTFSSKPRSSLTFEDGRCRTQMWLSLSTAIPPTWPMIQLLGNGFGQEASTLYSGGACALAIEQITSASK